MNTDHSTPALPSARKLLKKFTSQRFELLALSLALSGPPASSLCRAQETSPLAPPSPPAASVTTDQSDYPPGATAAITGSGFPPGETIELVVLHVDAGYDNASSPA